MKQPMYAVIEFGLDTNSNNNKQYVFVVNSTGIPSGDKPPCIYRLANGNLVVSETGPETGKSVFYDSDLGAAVDYIKRFWPNVTQDAIVQAITEYYS